VLCWRWERNRDSSGLDKKIKWRRVSQRGRTRADRLSRVKSGAGDECRGGEASPTRKPRNAGNPRNPGDRRNVLWYFRMVARLARVIALGFPHHVTQRGNARQFILSSDGDRAVYLGLLGDYAQLHGLSLLGYCLMSNHVHLIVVPRQSDSLARTLKQTHGRYASYWNACHKSSGHVWQGRYYSCPLDMPHLWAALRYIELNPVRAGLVGEAESWGWSSAAAHCGASSAAACLEMDIWRQHWNVASWREYLAVRDTELEAVAIRQCTHTGRPLGTPDFVANLEQATLRRLAPQKGGRPKNALLDDRQDQLAFAD
jgi:putative transposase